MYVRSPHPPKRELTDKKIKRNMSKNLRKQGEQKQKHKFDPPGKQWPQEPNGLEPLGVISSPLARWGKRESEREEMPQRAKRGASDH